MTKHDMAKRIAEKVTDVTLIKIEEVVDEYFNVITDLLIANESYNQKNFGTFKKIPRAARKGRNPQTSEVIDIPATQALKIVVSHKLKDKLKL